jgi:hypothetical protein
MARLRLPPPTRVPRAALPPELRWDAAPPSVALLLGRREFLKIVGVVLAAFAAPVVRVERAVAKARGSFFTKSERATLGALVDRILPPDDVPGAKSLGVATYVERFLTALDRKRARLFAGGPFSGRNPFPDAAAGAPARKRPKNAFKKFLPPGRLQELFWRGELFGTAGIPELAALDAQLGGPKKGLRDVYREGLAKVDQVATATRGAAFSALAPADQDAVLEMLADGAFEPDARRDGRTFLELVVRHTLEGAFAPPEYGGNADGAGWAMLGLEGDSQPLGYSIFSTSANGYVERPDHPMSTPNPDELGPGGTVVPKPLSAEAIAIQEFIVLATSIFGE